MAIEAAKKLLKSVSEHKNNAVETNAAAATTQLASTNKHSVTTTRSVTIKKKTTTFKKKCWTGYNQNKFLAINSLEMCLNHGYNVDGLYVVPEFSKLLTSLNKKQYNMASRITYPRDYSLSVKKDDEFDVIVVGCGAAGSVLAAKLSDNKDLNVLLLEAGNAPSMESEIPGLWANSIGSEIDWKFMAKEDETFGQSLVNKRAKIVRGRCLGGTTVLNMMLYDRGMELDYQKFESVGLTKWGWSNVVNYYKRSEDCKFEKITTDETVGKTHSKGGVLSVDSFRNTRTVEIRQVYSKALRSVKYNTLDFFSVKNHQGFSSSVATIKNGLRVNAARAFLRNADKKYNLKIAAGSLVKRVLFDGKKAVGVEFVNSVGEVIQVKSKQYVALSAGPIGSPKLLLESGIGPKAVLDSMSIPVVACNDRVGMNLQAHPMFIGLLIKFDTQPITSYSISEMVFEYLMKQSGPLATIGMSSFTGFIDVDGNGTPDVQIINYHYAMDDTVFMPSQLDALNYNDNITDQIIEVNDNHDIQIVGISLLQPKNTGKVILSKTEDDYEPVIEFGSLHEEDVNTVVKAINWVKKLMESLAFKQYGPKVVPLRIEGGPVPDAESDEYWKYAVKHLTTMNVQMAGTNSMATESTAGVVNEELEVFDVEGLMVVDSSALPVIFSAESSAPSMMIGEKAADIIKGKLGYRDDDDDDTVESSDEKSE